MAPITNGRSLFSEVPTSTFPLHRVAILTRSSCPSPRIVVNPTPLGYPEPGKHVTYDTSETIDLETVSLNGGVLVKVLYLSIDPYMRGRMRPESVPSYVVRLPVSLDFWQMSGS